MNNIIQKPYPKIGVNVFVLRDGKILLGKRIGKTGYGTWCLPGGHFEYGESLAGAAERELEEETSIVSSHLRFLHLVNDPMEHAHYVHIDFIADEWTGEPRVTEPDKFAEWKFFDLNNLPTEIFIGHQKLIPAFMNSIAFIDSEKGFVRKDGDVIEFKV